MMIVPNFVGPSAIEGVGIFASAPIHKGAVIWTLDDRYDLLLTAEDIEAMDPLQRDFVDRYGYPHVTRPGLTVVEYDNGRFMNHSEEPNTDFTDPMMGYATRNIAAGEEITCNYRDFDPAFVMQPGRMFAPAEAAMATPAE